MAKSKGFFGIRTGSTKNFTFSELHGEQITKERVSKVKNPRTISQMRQRMLMATIGAAYSYLKAIADHSFEGKTVGQQNMSEFMRLNLNKFRDASLNNSAAYAFNAYQDKLINPMRFILAKGSLPAMPFVVNATNQIELSYNVTDVSTAEKVYEIMGLSKGDMVTFVWVVGTSSLVGGIFKYTPNRLNIVRLKADKTGAIATPHDAFSFESNHDDLDINIGKQGDVLKLSSTIANIGAVILSRQSNGVWLRSNATMAGNKSIYEGVTVGNQLGTYPIESELILNGGDMTNQPTVETLPIPALSLATYSVSITEKGGTVAAPKLTGAPETATVTYTSNNKSIATVNSTSGQVTAVGNGTAVITINVAATDTTSATSISFNVVISGQTNEGGSGNTGSGTQPGGGDNVDF
jgi:hypothetical protein